MMQQAKPTLSIVGIVGVPPEYGGWETLVANVLPRLVRDYDVTVFCSSKAAGETISEYRGARLRYIPLEANGIQSIPYDLRALWLSRKSDFVLILGVSGCVGLPYIRRFAGAEYTLNIDGLEWRRQKWSRFASAFLKLSEAVGIRYSDNLISDNEVIRQYIKDTYRRDSHLIGYGGDSDSGSASPHVVSTPPLVGYAFSVCRIEPENNIHVILEAFSRLDVRLTLVGNWERSPYGRDLYQRFANVHNLTLLHPIYSRKHLDLLRGNCSLYVHGHSAGGTNPSLVEAMWLGRSLACFDVDFNRETTENKAHYFADAKALADLVTRVFPDPSSSNAVAMKEIADRRYTWAPIAAAYSAAVSGAPA